MLVCIGFGAGGLEMEVGLAASEACDSVAGDGSFVGFGIHRIPGMTFLGGGVVIGALSADGGPALIVPAAVCGRTSVLVKRGSLAGMTL